MVVDVPVVDPVLEIVEDVLAVDVPVVECVTLPVPVEEVL